MQYIRDMIFVRSLERHLGRPLSDMELLKDEIEGEFDIEYPNGRIVWISIPRLIFPHDLITHPADLDLSLNESFYPSDFEIEDAA